MKEKCPYAKKCQVYKKEAHICNQGKGYYGSKWKADDRVKKEKKKE